jgi:GNAT superfamily N-acetyltransferase
LHIVDEKTAKIERVAVIADYRKQGVGREVILEAEKWLTDMGIEKVIITSREEAVGFYEKLGYTVDWNKKEEGGIFTIVYTEKDL